MLIGVGTWHRIRENSYKNQTASLVEEMASAPADRMETTSSLSETSPPQMRGSLIWLLILLISLGMGPGRISMTSGLAVGSWRRMES